ncbi:MAG: carboxypeptidase regulatory-like domain-containing protein [Acidobacteriia bacterium]|nr:carboxypeptidase regulatory-like domain-containing protein [Terriglobia bacterium]
MRTRTTTTMITSPQRAVPALDTPGQQPTIAPGRVPFCGPLPRGRFSVLLVCLFLAMPLAEAKEKKTEAKTLLSGSVFREPGFALRGASVVVSSTESGKKKQEWKTLTDARGEFVLRVAAGPASYNVVVSAVGFQSEQKPVTLAGEENAELSFLLQAAPVEGEKR